MYLTLLLILFLFVLPTLFKRVGVILLTEKKKRGHLLYFLSKFIFWAIMIEISYVWLDLYYFYFALGLCLSLLTIEILEKKDFIFPSFTKRRRSPKQKGKKKPARDSVERKRVTI